jgi:glyoxylase-like metal-dependent hydrolase (beta-lactamase superfamily II)
MVATSFPVQIGEFDCLVINDGFLTVGPCKLDIHCMLIKNGKHSILIDTGCGVSVQIKAGKLIENMQIEGIGVSEIDTIIHTHAHSDHIGGNTDGNGKAVFSNARHIIHKTEWAYWEDQVGQSLANEKSPPMVGAARKNLLPLRDRFDFVENERDILPGIRFDLAPGHTPGSIVLKLLSNGKHLLCIGDLIHDPLEFKQPDLYAMIDFSHEQAVQIRNEVLSQAFSSHTLVWACHFPFPGLGYIVRHDDLFDWQPAHSF